MPLLCQTFLKHHPRLTTVVLPICPVHPETLLLPRVRMTRLWRHWTAYSPLLSTTRLLEPSLCTTQKATSSSASPKSGCTPVATARGRRWRRRRGGIVHLDEARDVHGLGAAASATRALRLRFKASWLTSLSSSKRSRSVAVAKSISTHL